MSTLITLFTSLIVLAAIALVLIVLVQNSKGGGLSSGFSSSNAIMGVRKTTDFLEKATWSLAGFIMVMSIVCVMIMPKAGDMPATQIETQQTVPAGAPDLGTELPAAPAQAPVATPTPPATTPAN